MHRLSIASLLIVFGIGFTGCTDSFTGSEGTNQGVSTAASPSKMRHAHLLRTEDTAGKILERYSELMVSSEFVVGFDDLVLNATAVLERYEALPGVEVTYEFKKVYRGMSMRVDGAILPIADFLEMIENDPDISWIEPDSKVKMPLPKDSKFKGGNNQYLPWGIDRIDADLSSTRSGDGTGSVNGVQVFVLDTGIKAHDVDVVDERHINAMSSAGDGHGHGTHVAGTIGANDNDSGIVGVAPRVDLHNYKVLFRDGTTNLSNVISAVEYITGYKQANPTMPVVVNISFGADIGTTEYTSLDYAIEASINAGVIYVIAAGNDRIDASTVTPAHVAGAITVGAYNEDDRFAPFSNHGPTIDLMAPGTKILSNSNATGAKRAPVLMSGTSMAAPHVTGTAALYLSKNPTASPDDVLAALLANARPWVTNAPNGTTNLSVYAGNF